MSYQVVVLARAERELREIVAWLYARSPQGAANWLTAFEAAKRTLAINPEAGALAPESESVGTDIRQILFKTKQGRRYRAIFVIVEKQVRILRIRGPGQALLESEELEQ
jgi:plasmid stabilization system protein ParE